MKCFTWQQFKIFFIETFFRTMKHACPKFVEGKIARKLRRAPASFDNTFSRRNSLASLYFFVYVVFHAYFTLSWTADIPEFYSEVCKVARLAASEGAPEFCLTFLRNSIPPSTFTHPSFTVFSPSLQADIMLTSLRPSIFRAARRSRWSMSSIRPLLLFSVFLLRFLFATC